MRILAFMSEKELRILLMSAPIGLFLIIMKQEAKALIYNDSYSEKSGLLYYLSITDMIKSDCLIITYAKDSDQDPIS